MVARNLGQVQEVLNELNQVQKDINELIYYRNALESPNHSDWLCAFVSSTINLLKQQHSEIIDALIMYGTTYQSIDESMAKSSNPNYKPTSVCHDFTYVSAPEHQKTFWEKTWNQIVFGDFSDDATWLGGAVSIGTAFFGIDAPMDLRDLSANVTKGEWGWAAVSVVSLLPIVGVLGKGGKVIVKGSKATDGSSIIIKQGENITPKSMIDDYFNDLLKRSEFPQTIINDGSTWTKITTEQNDIMRTDFNRMKKSLITDWENKNNLKWPRYDTDLFTESGKRLRKVGDAYDVFCKFFLQKVAS